MRIRAGGPGAPSRLVETVVASMDARKIGRAAITAAAAACAGKGDRPYWGCLTFKTETGTMETALASRIGARLAEGRRD